MSKMYPDPQGPPPPGFVPPPPYTSVPQPQAPPTGQPSVVIVQNTTCVGPDPQSMVCPYCQADIVTRVDAGPTATTHLIFILCCLFICWPCAPFVYCTDCCLAKRHYCPRCNRFLGQCD